MPVDWLNALAPPVTALEHALHESAFIDTVYVGPRTRDRIDYPAGEVLPESISRSDPNEYTFRLRANLYFSRDRDTEFVDDILHGVADVTEEAMLAFRATDRIGQYVPSSFETYAGELDNTLVVLMSIQFEVTTLVDVADAGST